jgi:hypothetical protein
MAEELERVLAEMAAGEPAAIDGPENTEGTENGAEVAWKITYSTYRE